VYRCFDERDGARGFEGRRAMLLEALGHIEKADDLALLPANDLATSPLTERLRDLGAFRADVTGAGPAVYGLFSERAAADRAAEVLRTLGRTLVARPAW
jgi:shikimate kinase